MNHAEHVKNKSFDVNRNAEKHCSLLQQFACIVALIVPTTISLQFYTNPTSEMSTDEKNLIKDNKTLEQSDESASHDVDIDLADVKDTKKYLDDAMKTVLDPNSIIQTNKDDVEVFKFQLEELDKENKTLGDFMEDMDNLSLEVCKTSQEALWCYVTDISNEGKKNKMVGKLFIPTNFLLFDYLIKVRQID